MSAISPPDLKGQVVLGRYRILRRLAHGGMGSVYLGRTEGAEGFARPVVIKRVLPGLSDDREIVQMFVREARILSNLHHPNIVTVLDFGQEGNGAYLMVLEYVHGYQLAEWHQFASVQRGRVSVAFAVHIMCKVLDALHYAHTFKRADGKAMQIIHRDVTPTNVLLTDQGMVKLLDFGIARVSGDDSAIVTERARVKGKLPYLPVEAFRGADPSVASDVYSAGLTLYEVLTGENPFLGNETAHIYLRVLETVPTPIHQLRDDVTPELDAVVQRAMHKDASQRFASAAEFAQALRALRQESDEVVSAQLAAVLSEDFHDAMPTALGLEPLSSRELAWRGSSSPPALQVLDLPRTERATIPANANTEHDPITVRADVSPSLMAVAVSSLSPPRPPGEVTPLPPAAGKRTGVAIALMAAVVGAAAALLAWSAMAPAPPVHEQLVVIQRESANSAAATNQTAREQQTALAATREPEPTHAAEQATGEPRTKAEERAQPDTNNVTTTQKSRANASPSSPAPPDPTVLSQMFSRKQARVEACFRKQGANLETLPELSIHFRVTEAGEVAEAKISPQDMETSPLGQCLLAIARSTHFGALAHGVAFRIPISLEKIAKRAGAP